MNRKRFALGAIALLVAATMAQPAQAGYDHRDNAVDVVNIVGDSNGFTAPPSHAAGHVTFRVGTSHPGGGLFTLVRLRPGATLGTLLPELMRGLSENRAESAAGGRAVQRQATIWGSAAVQPGRTMLLTALLAPGAYHIINLQDLFEGGVPQAAARLRGLTITDRWSDAVPPHPNEAVVFTLSGDEARFHLPATLPGNAPILMLNLNPQLGEAVFIPVQPGTTRQQLQHFFDAANRGDTSVPSPFVGGPVGVPSLSPGHAVTVQVGLPPGEYALVTWYPNFDDGNLLAAQGQVAAVRIV